MGWMQKKYMYTVEVKNCELASGSPGILYI